MHYLVRQPEQVQQTSERGIETLQIHDQSKCCVKCVNCVYGLEGFVDPGTQAAETLVPSLSRCVAVGVHSTPELVFDECVNLTRSFRVRPEVG